ncbi:D-alanine--D-alanine ligase family protein [Aquipuribacter sp. MA13-6]|uniref:D-alanine--D-alanine ligase family protein n=1 Tax=unclassified Aquipuribacter TaxID=2635084 RepID=UPI003EEB098A
MSAPVTTGTDRAATARGAEPAGTRAATDLDVLVLAGGLSAEREVSLASGRRVVAALHEAGVHSEAVDVGADLLDVLQRRRPDVIWPVLHGAGGEDGSLAQVLELVGLPVVGSAPGPSRTAWDKTTAATVVGRTGIRVPRSVTLTHTVLRDLGAAGILPHISRLLPLPVVVKPVHGGSALGVGVVREEAELARAMMAALGHDTSCRVEQLVSGVEVAVAVVDDGSGPRALPPVEIAPDSGSYDYEARYTPGATEFHCPARLPGDVLARVQQDSVAVHRELGLSRLSRSDWIVDAEGEPWFLEVNTSPGMTGTSLLPQAVVAAGESLPELYRALAAAAAAVYAD